MSLIWKEWTVTNEAREETMISCVNLLYLQGRSPAIPGVVCEFWTLLSPAFSELCEVLSGNQTSSHQMDGEA